METWVLYGSICINIKESFFFTSGPPIFCFSLPTPAEPGFWPIDPMLLRLAKLGRLLRLMRLVRKLKGFDAPWRGNRKIFYIYIYVFILHIYSMDYTYIILCNIIIYIQKERERYSCFCSLVFLLVVDAHVSCQPNQ